MCMCPFYRFSCLKSPPAVPGTPMLCLPPPGPMSIPSIRKPHSRHHTGLCPSYPSKRLYKQAHHHLPPRFPGNTPGGRSPFRPHNRYRSAPWTSCRISHWLVNAASFLLDFTSLQSRTTSNARAVDFARNTLFVTCIPRFNRPEGTPHFFTIHYYLFLSQN